MFYDNEDDQQTATMMTEIPEDATPAKGELAYVRSMLKQCLNHKIDVNLKHDIKVYLEESKKQHNNKKGM